MATFRKGEEEGEAYELIQQTFGEDGYGTLNPEHNYQSEPQQPQQHDQLQQSPSFQQQPLNYHKSAVYKPLPLPTSKFAPEEPDSQSESAQKFSTKIREQAEQISKLEKYKLLCEKRILSLQPGHPLPVTLSHFDSKDERSQQHNEKIVDLKAQLHARDSEIRVLQEQMTMSKQTSPNASFQDYRSPQSRREEFIPQSDDINTNYNLLYGRYKALLREKEAIEASFSNETMENEHKRAYIQVLKQLLDQKLETLGFPRTEKTRVDWAVEWQKNIEKVNQVQEEVSQYRIRYNDTKASADYHQKQNEELIRANEKYSEELRECRQACITLEKTLHARDCEKQALEEEKSNLLAYIEKNKLDSLVRKITDQKIQAEYQNEEINRLKHRVQDLEAENNRLKYEQRCSVTHIHDHQEKNPRKSAPDKLSLQSQTKTVATERQSVNQAVSDENETLKRKISNLEKELDHVKTTLEKNETEYKSLIGIQSVHYSNQISSLSHQIAGYQEKEYMSRRDIDFMSSNIDNCMEQLRTVEASKKELEIRLNYQSDLYQTLEREKEIVQNTNLTKEQQLIEVKTESVSLKKELSEMRSYVSTQSIQLQEAQEHEKQLEAKCIAQGEEISSFQGIISGLRNRYGIESLHKREEIKDLISCTDDLRSKVFESKEEIDRANTSLMLKQEEIQLLNTRLETKMIQVQKLQDEVRALKRANQELAEGNSALSKLQAEQEKILKSLAECEGKFDEKAQEVRMLTTKLESSSKELHRATCQLQQAEKENIGLKVDKQSLRTSLDDRESEVRTLTYENKNQIVCIEELERRISESVDKNQQLSAENKKLVGLVVDFEESSAQTEENQGKLQKNLSEVQSQLFHSIRMLRGRIADMFSCYPSEEVEDLFSWKFRETANGLTRQESEEDGTGLRMLELLTIYLKLVEAYQNDIEKLASRISNLKKENVNDKYRIKELEQKCFVAGSEGLGSRNKELTLRRELETLKEENFLTTLEKRTVRERESRIETENLQLRKEVQRLERECEALEAQLHGVKEEKLRTTLEFKAHTQTLETEYVQVKNLESLTKLLQREKDEFKSIINKMLDSTSCNEFKKPVLELLSCLDEADRLERDHLRLRRQVEDFETGFNGGDGLNTGYYRSLRADMDGLKRNVEDNSLNLNRLINQKKQLFEELKYLVRSQNLRGEDKKAKLTELTRGSHDNKENLREKDPNVLDMNDRETKRIVRAVPNDSKAFVSVNSNTPRKIRESKNQKQMSTILVNNTELPGHKKDSSGCKNLQDRLSQTRRQIATIRSIL